MELESLWSDYSFEHLWIETKQFALKGDILPPLILPSHFKVNTYFPVLDININDIKTKFEENNLKILNALQSGLNTIICSNENILKACNIYDLKKYYLKTKL